MALAPLSGTGERGQNALLGEICPMAALKHVQGLEAGKQHFQHVILHLKMTLNSKCLDERRRVCVCD